jgi:hypothetical protein
VTVKITPASVELPTELDSRWNRIPGITVDGKTVTVGPNEYFFRLESRTWTVIDWDKVVDELMPINETSTSAIEQITLDFIAANARTTDDPAEVMRIAWQVYSFLFRADHLPALGLEGITEAHLRMLAEVSVFTTLNKVEQEGRITNVGPCWFFADAARVVFDLDETTVGLLDEVYHGGWFNETRAPMPTTSRWSRSRPPTATMMARRAS